MVVCDKWVAVKVFEVIFCISCVVCKRVTDDESVRVSLYLQKLSREWSLLRNVTWSSIGASFGDAVYGGYVIITFGLLLGKIFREVPKGRRILEGFLLGIGALFFVVLGGLELASLDSIPDNLIDNAAVLGVLSLVTAALFLIDLAGPRGRSSSKHSQTEKHDVEKNIFGYPTLPGNGNAEIKNEKDDKANQKNKFFPEKFKKTKKNKNTDMGENSKVPENDDVDTFPTIEKEDDKNNDKEKDYSEDNEGFETMERSKYGSVRNGQPKNPEMELFQKMPPKPKYPNAKTERSVFDHEIEMMRNMEYLKQLEEKNRTKNDSKYYDQESPQMVNKFMKDYKKSMSLQLDDNSRNYPHNRSLPHTDDRHRNWEAFEEESLPPFPVREDYLPELQTPVFARIKESKNPKSYSIYDNYSNYNIPTKKSESSQTDSMKNKNDTLRTKPPTLQQIAEYFGLEQKKNNRVEKKEMGSQVSKDDLPAVAFFPMPSIKERREAGDNQEPMSPTDPGYVQYTAQNWNDRLNRKYSSRTPRHSPTDD